VQICPECPAKTAQRTRPKIFLVTHYDRRWGARWSFVPNGSISGKVIFTLSLTHDNFLWIFLRTLMYNTPIFKNRKWVPEGSKMSSGGFKNLILLKMDCPFNFIKENIKYDYSTTSRSCLIGFQKDPNRANWDLVSVAITFEQSNFLIDFQLQICSIIHDSHVHIIYVNDNRNSYRKYLVQLERCWYRHFRYTNDFLCAKNEFCVKF